MTFEQAIELYDAIKLNENLFHLCNVNKDLNKIYIHFNIKNSDIQVLLDARKDLEPPTLNYCHCYFQIPTRHWTLLNDEILNEMPDAAKKFFIYNLDLF